MMMFPKPLKRAKTRTRRPRKGIKPKSTLSILKSYSKQEKKSYWEKEADKAFSGFIRKRDRGICVYCKKVVKRSGVSHYYSRRYKGTRWDGDNCDWACWMCHQYRLEHFKAPGDWYHAYMVKKLGEAGVERLNIKAHAVTRFSMSDLKLLVHTYSLR